MSRVPRVSTVEQYCGASGTQWQGTPSQIEWAEQIRPRVDAEFDRVAEALEARARKQSTWDRLDTRAIIAILEEKRLAVLARNEAGYFIKYWQELTDQVQKLVRDDSRFAAIRLAKAARRKTLSSEAFEEPAHNGPRPRHPETRVPASYGAAAPGLCASADLSAYAIDIGDSPMNVRPLYDRIIVKRTEQEESMSNGIFIPDSAKEKPQQGDVIAVGRGRRLDNGQVVPLDVKTGDRILFGKYTGSEAKVDGTEYTIMREDDVLAILSSTANGNSSAGHGG
jgi:chaperonin GroES